MGRKDRIKSEKKCCKTEFKTNEEKKCHSQFNELFNNPMTKAALSALSDEDKERYRFIGEQLYGNINYEENKVLNNRPFDMVEAVAYIKTQLQSGLHPSMLEDNEKAILADVYGNEWYLEWGYVKEDLDDIVTLQPNFS